MFSADEKFPPRGSAADRRSLASAEAGFGALGFEKTSIVEIAAAAQASKPLVGHRGLLLDASECPLFGICL